MKLISPRQRYRELLSSGELLEDPVQAELVESFEKVYVFLLKNQRGLSYYFSKKKIVKGIYLWGKVGVGKTRLMDLFFESLPIEKKIRLHFHGFMKEVQDELRKIQGQRDPLKKVAKMFRARAKVICFDEFIVDEIADAMILGRLLNALFKEGITLIATSNTAPDNLYLNGLQRKSFLPAIELIKKNTEVLFVESSKDYRLRALVKDGMYLCPIDENTESELELKFKSLAASMPEKIHFNQTIIIQDRPILTRGVAEKLVWFDFDVICNSPRSQLDYLEITHRYSRVFLSNLRQINPEENDRVCYLINLIDIFYDAHISLLISSEVPIQEIYPAGKFKKDFERTESRLFEMQSLGYHFSE